MQSHPRSPTIRNTPLSEYFLPPIHGVLDRAEYRARKGLPVRTPLFISRVVVFSPEETLKQNPVMPAVVQDTLFPPTPVIVPYDKRQDLGDALLSDSISILNLDDEPPQDLLIEAPRNGLSTPRPADRRRNSKPVNVSKP